MNKSGLIARVAMVIGFSSLIVGFLFTQIFYRLTYLNEVEVANQEIKQLFQTVSSTASIGAYLGDDELAKEVINGLETNDIVKRVNIKIGDKVLANEIINSDLSSVFELRSPFEKERTVGYLYIVPDLDYIELRAKKIGSNNSKALMAQAFIVTVIAIYIAYVLVTRPMLRIATELSGTTPGSNERLSVPVFHQDSELGGLVGDINKLLEKTEGQIAQERTLRKDIEVLEKRFRMLFENSVSPIVLMEPRGSILLFNSAFNAMLLKTGWKFKKNFGPLLSELFEDPEKLNKSVFSSFANNEISTGEYRLKSSIESELSWVQVVVTSIMSDDMKEYYQMTMHDISKRKKQLDKLEKLADYDQLTQLRNRRSAEKFALSLIENKTPFSLLMMDLNGFKQINDIYGHEAGDEILIHVASHLKKMVRRVDVASRWGGDEFVLLLSHSNEDAVLALTRKLMQKICKPYYLSQHKVDVMIGASIGASFYPNDSFDLQELLQKSDSAMYEVKKFKDKEPEKYLKFSSEKDNYHSL